VIHLKAGRQAKIDTFFNKIIIILILVNNSL